MKNVFGLYAYSASGNYLSKENYTIVDLQVQSIIYGNANLFIKAENIFSEEYNIEEGYPMPKASIMTGVKLSF